MTETTALIGNEALHHAVETYAARHDLGPGGTVIPEQAGSYVRRALACDPRRVLAAWCDDPTSHLLTIGDQLVLTVTIGGREVAFILAGAR